MKFKSIVVMLVPATAFAQTFSSGSTGADGILSYTTPGTYTFTQQPVSGNIYNFTTMTIATGVTLQIPGTAINGPIYWLAQGAVQINGTIDINGQDGFSVTNTTQRTYTIPGAGGYPGGFPGLGPNPASAGLGPAGGGANNGIANCNGYTVGGGGGFTGNQFLVPLVGGSGGGGINLVAGGAGGGAILIASSVSISGSGSINASGGAGIAGSGFSASGGGAGGGIRLVAPAVTLSGNLNANGGNPGGCNGGANGVVRVEAFSIGSINASGNLYTASPFGLFLSPTTFPSINVVSVGGQPVPASPNGSFTVPDVTINSTSPLVFQIQASNIPLGTTAMLNLFSENGSDQVIVSSALAGTVAQSTASASATLPPGFSKGFVTANWTQ